MQIQEGGVLYLVKADNLEVKEEGAMGLGGEPHLVKTSVITNLGRRIDLRMLLQYTGKGR
jgi:hypothetical protein